MNQPLRILFKYPCRGRVALFFKSLDSLNDNIRDRNNYHISLTIDTDDLELNTPEVIEKINTYPNVSIEWGLSESKIAAINRNVPDYGYDLIICWSMDMFMVMFGADDMIRDYAMMVANTREDFNFLLHIPEKDSMEALNVLYIATKDYYSMFNYIYHPSYISLWADNESYNTAKLLNRYHYVGVLGLYEHRNMAYTQYGIERDILFNHQQSFWSVDEANFYERQKRNFDLHLIENK
jgi:hypothetical protein